nr:DUF305 domain-containing protein [Kibdelosporangium sp. MJ126-NF4]CEL20267.1 putative lipoprotein [Kibdelosporangium sp. MJ126-NF4]CTQ97493.1 putative lipoprotein [Kibdelosporangium sp. MJ126-NF4]
MKRFHLAVAAVCLTTVTTLTACGSTEPAAPPAQPQGQAAPMAGVASEFNETDVMFLQMMIPHHTQGMEMLRLAKQEAQRPEIKDLVNAIDVTQADEAKTMTGWLTQWGKPTTADPNMSAHAEHGGLPATNPEVIAELAKAKGTQFESMFLNLFTGHQGAAVEMAQRELKDGTSAPVKEMADRVVKSRTGQIQQMLGMVGE